MCRHCKPVFRERWNSANPVLAICGKRCWISIRVEVLRAKAQRPRSALSCVWLGKHLTLKLHHAVPAREVLQGQLVSQERMDQMATRANQERRVQMGKMPARTSTCCQFHLTAHARQRTECPDQSDPRDRTAHLASLDDPAVTASLDLRDRLDLLAQLVVMATTALLVQREKTAIWFQARKAHPDHLDNPANPDHPAPLENPASLARMVPLVQLDHLANLALLAVPASLVDPDQTAMLANQAHLALATTAHQLVWPQDTKPREFSTRGSLFVSSRY